MRFDRGDIGFVVVAVLAAALFVRLGLWQLDRLEERRALNAVRDERLALPPVRLGPDAVVPARPDSLAWRRVEARGEYDFAEEVLVRSRALRGRPGVELLTPLRLDSTLAVLVLRGWLPAADGLRAALDDARPDPARAAAGSGRAVAVEGVLAPFPTTGDSEAIRFTVAGEEHPVVLRPERSAVADALPYPIYPLYVRAVGPVAAGGAFRRVPLPEASEGPHLGYAIQWFAFAAIALGGTALYLRRPRRAPRRSPGG